MELLSLSAEKLIILLQVMINSDEINFFKNNYQNEIGIFVKLISKVYMRWKNWRELKSFELMCFREEKSMEDQDNYPWIHSPWFSAIGN